MSLLRERVDLPEQELPFPPDPSDFETPGEVEEGRTGGKLQEEQLLTVELMNCQVVGYYFDLDRVDFDWAYLIFRYLPNKETESHNGYSHHR
jgi:hypothetical protein